MQPTPTDLRDTIKAMRDERQTLEMIPAEYGDADARQAAIARLAADIESAEALKRALATGRGE